MIDLSSVPLSELPAALQKLFEQLQEQLSQIQNRLDEFNQSAAVRGGHKI